MPSAMREVSGLVQVRRLAAWTNPSCAIEQRIGADPSRPVLDVVGDQGPQKLVNGFAHLISAGEAGVVRLVGAEAIWTVRHLRFHDVQPDWGRDLRGRH